MSAISSATATDAAVSTPASRFNELSSEDFIKIIFEELTNQDPLEPSDTSALLDQLNSIRQIESDLQLTQKLDELVTENQLASASSMIGKFIAGRTEDFQTVTGFVAAALKQGDEITLELDTGWRVPLGNVETILDPEPYVEPDPEPEAEEGEESGGPSGDEGGEEDPV